MINRFKGEKEPHLERSKKRSQSGFQEKPRRVQFLKAKFSGQDLSILEGQGSGMLQSFAESNALVFLPEESAGLKNNDTVEIIDLRSADLQ